MGKFLNTRGQPTLGIGICGRCSRKFPLAMLYSDANSPGLRVCQVDMDQFDPYRLAPRQPDPIVLPFTRPDLPIGTNPLGLPTEDDNYFIITEDANEYLKP
ncbi:hypothetical protein UFOVP468_63 [uncultured Caudovirales phage]|uniref:Uncharacterized protein n=1 Tax=uncultured Caudovirales phage TaxID=2100421 RepID=A0A6J5MHH7_9CAUD|nr:hypothetical protein UFOVP468_63 [uncultured Caudovirales phage]